MGLTLTRRSNGNSVSATPKFGDAGYGGTFSGKYYPDQVDRVLQVVTNNGRFESHLVPLEEEHSLCAKACDCGVQGTTFMNRSVFFHHSDINRIPVATHLPVEV